MEEALIAALLANAGLTAFVDDRIDWLKRPQASSLPAITLQVASSPYSYTLNGRDTLTDRLVQIDIWGSTYASMKATARAVRLALDELNAVPMVAFIENERETHEGRDDPGNDGSTDFFRTSIDARIWSDDAA